MNSKNQFKDAITNYMKALIRGLCEDFIEINWENDYFNMSYENTKNGYQYYIRCTINLTDSIYKFSVISHRTIIVDSNEFGSTSVEVNEYDMIYFIDKLLEIGESIYKNQFDYHSQDSYYAVNLYRESAVSLQRIRRSF